MSCVRSSALAALVCVVCAVWVPSAHARACDVVARPGGAVATPRELVRKLNAGEVGCLRAGRYSERQVIVRTPGITLRSYPGQRATWVGRIVVAADRVTIAHLNLDGRAGPPCLRRGCYPADGVLPNPTLNAPNARLISNDITNPEGICVNIRSFYGMTPNRFRVLRNRIHDCRPANNHVHGVYVVNGRRGIIRHNVIHDNGDKGIVLYPNADREIVHGNTIDGNRTGIHFGGGRRTASGGNTVRFNILSFPRPHDGLPARFNVEYHWPGPVGSRNTVRRNCFFSDSPDPFFLGSPLGSGVIAGPHGFTVADVLTADPMYLDRDGLDFRVGTASACAGFGAPESVASAAAWCAEVAPRGSRRRLYRAVWQARVSCYGPQP